jgi:hypothetical protein
VVVSSSGSPWLKSSRWRWKSFEGGELFAATLAPFDVVGEAVEVVVTVLDVQDLGWHQALFFITLYLSPAFLAFSTSSRINSVLVDHRGASCLRPQCLLDHLVGAGMHRWWNGDAKLLRNLQVDDDLELRRLFHR